MSDITSPCVKCGQPVPATSRNCGACGVDQLAAEMAGAREAKRKRTREAVVLLALGLPIIGYKLYSRGFISPAFFSQSRVTPDDEPLGEGIAFALRSRSTESAFPLPIAPEKVGTYSMFAKAGAGYFFDDVLEYRVWGGDEGRVVAFGKAEDAYEYARRHPTAEAPLALVVQREWIDEPEEGTLVPKRGHRVAEWQIEWLPTKHREPGSIEAFMAAHGHPGPVTFKPSFDE